MRNRPSRSPSTAASATCSGSIARGPSRAEPAGPASASMSVRTPWGQITCARTPRCRYVTSSHSAKPSEACLVTEYGAAPRLVSNPAADTVARKCPRPRSSQRGSSSRAARTWAITLTSHTRAHCSSGTSGPPATAMPALAQNRSISPSVVRAAATSARTPSSDAASPATAVPPIRVATADAASPSRSATTTRAPSAASRVASAAPIPRPPPVTTTPAPASSSVTVHRRGSHRRRRRASAR